MFETIYESYLKSHWPFFFFLLNQNHPYLLFHHNNKEAKKHTRHVIASLYHLLNP